MAGVGAEGKGIMRMDIRKMGKEGQEERLGQGDMDLIHEFTRRKVPEEELYTFSVRLCDTGVDRDYDCFTRKTLEELGEMFVGKSGLFDHKWSAEQQACRIYRTELLQEDWDGLWYLKAYVYMLRTEGNRDLIAEIEAGIKKEVSVGCRVSRSICTICGEDIGTCPHEKGKTYEGESCYALLEGAEDAYEFSFVAVPAQRKSGVMQKGYSEGEKGENMEELLKQAEIGRAYLAQMQEEVERLGGLCEEQESREVVKGMIGKMSLAELQVMKGLWQEKVAKKYPMQLQLDYGQGEERGTDGAFLI